jgi:hypothetical protein
MGTKVRKQIFVCNRLISVTLESKHAETTTGIYTCRARIHRLLSLNEQQVPRSGHCANSLRNSGSCPLWAGVWRSELWRTRWCKIHTVPAALMYIRSRQPVDLVTDTTPVVDLFCFTDGLFMQEVSIWFLLNTDWEDKLVMNGKLCAAKRQ